MSRVTITETAEQSAQLAALVSQYALAVITFLCVCMVLAWLLALEE